MISLELESILEDSGAEIIGPVGTLDAAIKLIELHDRIDIALLDVDLHGVHVFPAADLLEARHVPFVFHTGHGEIADLKQKFAHVPVCNKPVEMDR